jgi:tetratricopeptide (TPR) repeat protein
VTKLLELSLALSRQIEDRGQVPSTLHQLSVSLIFDGNYTDGLSFLRESVAIYDDLGISNYGVELVMFGIALTHLGDYDKASDYSLIALRHAQESNDLRRVGFVKMNLGWIALAKDQNQAAKSFVQESIVIFRETKAMLGLSQTLGTMGYVALRLNDAQAQDYFHESLKITVETKLIVPQTTNLVGVALLLLARGEVERAVELYALALRHRRVANSAWYQVVAGQYIAAAAETLPPEVIAAAEARGQARDLWETAAELLAEFDAVVRPY